MIRVRLPAYNKSKFILSFRLMEISLGVQNLCFSSHPVTQLVNKRKEQTSLALIQRHEIPL